MNGSDIMTRKPIIRCLVEGQSIRATARNADVSKNTVSKLPIDAGKTCTAYQDRVQLTSDGHKAYLEAVEGAFGGDVDYAQLVKVYGDAPESEKRYSPPVCVGARKHRIEGRPDPAHVSTSYAERNNQTMRMSIRRFTRLTNAFSKKIENHAHSVAPRFMHYNFCRQHKSLDGISPAMAAGVTDRPWDIEDIVRLVDEAGPKPGPSGPYKKRNSN